MMVGIERRRKEVYAVAAAAIERSSFSFHGKYSANTVRPITSLPTQSTQTHFSFRRQFYARTSVAVSPYRRWARSRPRPSRARRSESGSRHVQTLSILSSLVRAQWKGGTRKHPRKEGIQTRTVPSFCSPTTIERIHTRPCQQPSCGILAAAIILSPLSIATSASATR